MTELSFAALAVLNAYQLAPIEDELTAAAVLRVVANQIEDLYCDSDVEDSPGIVFALRQLMLIADELERQHTRGCDLTVIKPQGHSLSSQGKQQKP